MQLDDKYCVFSNYSFNKFGGITLDTNPGRAVCTKVGLAHGAFVQCSCMPSVLECLSCHISYHFPIELETVL